MTTQLVHTNGFLGTGMIKTIELNLCGLCNLKCSFCPRSQSYPNTNDHMSQDTINLICDHINQIDYPVEVHLSGRGEPTLHKDFANIVRTLKDKTNAIVHLTTNGVMVDKHIEAVESIDKIVYNVYSDDEDEFFEAIETRNNLNIDMIYFKSNDGQHTMTYRDGSIIQDNMLLTNRAGNINIQNITPSKGYCRRPFEKIFINWNGDYILCCEDWSDKTLGNIKYESILDYYNNNKQLQEYKTNLLANTRVNTCVGCSFPG
jgi:MoaA/NifB/PqqE/SkfB family radical SAM enzyme